MSGCTKKLRRNFLLPSLLCQLLTGAVWSSNINFEDVLPYGTPGNLSGQVAGVTYNNHKVLVYIYVSGWWNKPTWVEPLTSIGPDGTWTCNITTGIPSDTYATEIIAFLIPDGSYQPSWELAGAGQLPSELLAYPYDWIYRPPRTIDFAGHNWAVKVGDYLGPGPNDFSDSEQNVWVDGNGYLHLKITSVDGQWKCSEIVSQESFGYGTYVFTVQSRFDLLDENIVLGLFTWDTYAPDYHYREIDFEFSQWQTSENDNSQYVIQPWTIPSNLYRFETDYSGSSGTTTHVMTWRPDGIYFKSYYGDFTLAPDPAGVINDWYYTGIDNPPPGAENVRMNYWLIYGNPPADGLESEIIISDFQFLSDISDQPADINDDNSVDMGDFSKITANWQNSGCGVDNAWCSEADLTCDGSVGIEDILAFIDYWLES